MVLRMELWVRIPLLTSCIVTAQTVKNPEQVQRDRPGTN